MRLLITLLLLIPLFAFSEPPHVPISPIRSLNEPFEHALKRVKQKIPNHIINALKIRETPIGKKVPVEQIDFSFVPVVASHDELIRLFKLVRDTRFLYRDNKPDFQRRISWLYPDDGCFARAALSVIKLEEEHFLLPAKIFAFGDLILQTPYSLHGYVSWWYHVSIAVRYMGSVYVFDPALNQERPLLVDDWYNKMKGERGLDGVICNSYTYDPFDKCDRTIMNNKERALKDEFRYLDKEWTRISFLGLDPITILGNNPPWILDLKK